MSEFKCEVMRVQGIEPIENADRIEVVVIEGYRSIALKGQFRVGHKVVYIPEAAVLPERVIKRLGLWDEVKNKGKLSGGAGNRVKAVKLRGVLSQGLVYPTGYYGLMHVGADECCYVDGYGLLDGVESAVILHVGDDASETLGIVKYDPMADIGGKLRDLLAGEVVYVPEWTMHYDLENLKRHPNTFIEGEEVIYTEKIHGTFVSYGYVPELDNAELLEGKFVMHSKGLGGKGVAFKWNEANANNLYVNAFKDNFGAGERLKNLSNYYEGQPVYILGEIFGKGIQDLSYSQENEPGFRFFDIYVGKRGQGRFLDEDELQKAAVVVGQPRVPVIEVGPYSRQRADELVGGTETVSGNAFNIREGLVIRPAKERDQRNLGRVILKHISEAYLLRKGGTEIQ